MLYIIGLGLSHESISSKGLEIAKRCKKIYLESYTVDLPYSIGAIKELVGKKVFRADRQFIESLEIIDEAVRSDVALLVYGSPLTATTHITLLEEAKKSKVKFKVLYNASVFDAVAETGLQLYKFGKIASMPKWQPEKKYTPDSFMEIVQQNLSMKAHSLILVDIGLMFHYALKQLEDAAKKHNVSLKEVVVCQGLGTSRQKIFYSDFSGLRRLREISAPYCFIIPSKLHFVEKEFLEGFKI
jgi:diphthine synthase